MSHSGRTVRETGQLWAWQGMREGQAGEAPLDGEECSAGSCVPRAGCRGPRGDRCGSLGPSAGSSPCQRMAGEHQWPGDWVPRGCEHSSPSDRAHLCARTQVARNPRLPTTAHLQRSPPYPDLGGGELPAVVWGCVPGCYARGAMRPCAPAPRVCLSLCSPLRDSRAPLLPWQSLGDIKGKQEKGYLEERVAKQPPPDPPPPSTANPKLVPGLQPD